MGFRISSNFVWSDGHVVEEYVDGSLDRNYVHGNQFIDELVLFEDSSGDYHYYLQDFRYSVYALVDDTGTIEERYRFDPYGKRTVVTDDGSIDEHYGFTSRYHDDSDETDLIYFRNRWMSAEVGRFVNRDPASYIDGMNLYAGYFIVDGLDTSGLKIQEHIQKVMSFSWLRHGAYKKKLKDNLKKSGITKTYSPWDIASHTHTDEIIQIEGKISSEQCCCLIKVVSVKTISESYGDKWVAWLYRNKKKLEKHERQQVELAAAVAETFTRNLTEERYCWPAWVSTFGPFETYRRVPDEKYCRKMALDLKELLESRLDYLIDRAGWSYAEHVYEVAPIKLYLSEQEMEKGLKAVRSTANPWVMNYKDWFCDDIRGIACGRH